MLLLGDVAGPPKHAFLPLERKRFDRCFKPACLGHIRSAQPDLDVLKFAQRIHILKRLLAITFGKKNGIRCFAFVFNSEHFGKCAVEEFENAAFPVGNPDPDRCTFKQPGQTLGCLGDLGLRLLKAGHVNQ